eukprot:gb/GEZN01004570.1/.p1 GENE.gb/GEZN01004570.1/~~gb/GEZN01004570.1/.p1  ORF type:complete len:527 (-),score=89.10 gb/GEZN01004570.1/:321-1901(-)
MSTVDVTTDQTPLITSEDQGFRARCSKKLRKYFETERKLKFSFLFLLLITFILVFVYAAEAAKKEEQPNEKIPIRERSRSGLNILAEELEKALAAETLINGKLAEDMLMEDDDTYFHREPIVREREKGKPKDKKDKPDKAGGATKGNSNGDKKAEKTEKIADSTKAAKEPVGASPSSSPTQGNGAYPEGGFTVGSPAVEIVEQLVSKINNGVYASNGLVSAICRENCQDKTQTSSSFTVCTTLGSAQATRDAIALASGISAARLTVTVGTTGFCNGGRRRLNQQTHEYYVTYADASPSPSPSPRVLSVAVFTDYPAHQDIINSLDDISCSTVYDMDTPPALSDLLNFDAVYLDCNYPPTKAILARLVQYIQAGGAVVEGAFLHAHGFNGTQPILGNEVYYTTFSPAGSSDFAGPEYASRNLGTVLLPTHPIMAGVGTVSIVDVFIALDTASDFNAATQVVAQYDGNGAIALVVFRDNAQGKSVVQLNAFLGFLSNPADFPKNFPGLAQILKNSFYWAVDQSGPSPP